MLTKEQICLKFLENPKINPEKGTNLKRGFKPFNSYVDLCRELGYDDEVDIILGLKKEPADPVPRETKEMGTTSKHRSHSPVQKEIRERNLEDPLEIVVNDVGTYTTGGRYGRTYWKGFVVTEVITPGKKIKIELDVPILIGEETMTQIDNPDGYGWITFIPESNKTRILEYRRPGRWMFKGETAKNRKGEISFGEKKTGAEEGIF